MLQGADKVSQGAHYLRNYTELAASVLQLGAWTLGESPASSQAAGGADENNSSSANSDLSQHMLLSPSLAALALQKNKVSGVVLSSILH